ncbi:MAG: TlyA family RNA methyltransferase [Lachnospiraceae bacterium]|nr:TlyA family RNA methyltransferase [Lachnospiraceae bacterium]
MKKRLDVLLTERGLAPSREQAKRHIMAGEVFVDGQREDKSGTLFPEEAEIELKGESLRYASRGGYKLEKALEVFPIELGGRICMDIGASTGGFTDCMLQNGAARVYSIDVGSGQLAWSLRNDERVVSMEKTNFRYMSRADFPESPDFASADVSFISLDKILPPAFDILNDEAEMVCLIKPQFEAGRDRVGKNGVVRDKETHREVIEKCTEIAAASGFKVLGLDYSPIKGPKGNIEYLMYIGKGGQETGAPLETDTEALVERAHEELK